MAPKIPNISLPKETTQIIFCTSKDDDSFSHSNILSKEPQYQYYCGRSIGKTLSEINDIIDNAMKFDEIKICWITYQNVEQIMESFLSEIKAREIPREVENNIITFKNGSAIEVLKPKVKD